MSAEADPVEDLEDVPPVAHHEERDPQLEGGDDDAADEDVAIAMARHVDDLPPRWFGRTRTVLAATLTLPDVEGALVDEAVRSLDHLGADGVVVLTNAGGASLRATNGLRRC